MDEMRTRRPWTWVLAVVLLLAVVVLAGACVPDPTNRPPSSAAEATPTLIPTPAGPTPTPTFVRPTPTPLPTFMTYKVVSGDSLDKIAKQFGTSARSIAYWNRATYPSLDPDSSTYRPNYLKLAWILVLIPHAEVDPENLPSLPPTAVPSGG
jgi:hypothetical protein